MADDDLLLSVEMRERKKLAIRQANETREQAIERGRHYGEQTAQMQGETGVIAEQRVQRSMAYAAWEYDGKPEDSGAKYRAEFGLPQRDVVLSGDRAASVRELKKT